MNNVMKELLKSAYHTFQDTGSLYTELELPKRNPAQLVYYADAIKNLVILGLATPFSENISHPVLEPGSTIRYGLTEQGMATVETMLAEETPLQ